MTLGQIIEKMRNTNCQCCGEKPHWNISLSDYNYSRDEMFQASCGHCGTHYLISERAGVPVSENIFNQRKMICDARTGVCDLLESAA